MRSLTLLSASILVLGLSAGSAFAIPSGDTLSNPKNSTPAYDYSAPIGHYERFTALAPSEAGDANALQYTPLPDRGGAHHGR